MLNQNSVKYNFVQLFKLKECSYHVAANQPHESPIKNSSYDSPFQIEIIDLIIYNFMLTYHCDIPNFFFEGITTFKRQYIICTSFSFWRSVKNHGDKRFNHRTGRNSWIFPPYFFYTVPSRYVYDANIVNRTFLIFVHGRANNALHSLGKWEKVASQGLPDLPSLFPQDSSIVVQYHGLYICLFQ